MFLFCFGVLGFFGFFGVVFFSSQAIEDNSAWENAEKFPLQRKYRTMEHLYENRVK